jgi:hypothetical protein
VIELASKITDSLLVEVDKQLLYNGIHMEAFIPREYFDKNLAEEIGIGYRVFGNFITYHYMTENATRKDAVEASFECPIKFHTVPDSVTEETVDIGFGEQKYLVLHYYNGSVIFSNSEIIRDPNNTEYTITLMMDGKLDTCDYDRIITLLNLSKIYNGVKLGIPALYEELMIAEYYRNVEDPTLPVRYTARSHGTRVRGLTLREKASFVSTFAAITSEDQISMFTVSDNAAREGRKEIISDIEKVTLGLI